MQALLHCFAFCSILAHSFFHFAKIWHLMVGLNFEMAVMGQTIKWQAPSFHPQILPLLYHQPSLQQV
jgi:hypothetical protein